MHHHHNIQLQANSFLTINKVPIFSGFIETSLTKINFTALSQQLLFKTLPQYLLLSPIKISPTFPPILSLIYLSHSHTQTYQTALPFLLSDFQTSKSQPPVTYLKYTYFLLSLIYKFLNEQYCYLSNNQLQTMGQTLVIKTA